MNLLVILYSCVYCSIPSHSFISLVTDIVKFSRQQIEPKKWHILNFRISHYFFLLSATIDVYGMYDL